MSTDLQLRRPQLQLHLPNATSSPENDVISAADDGFRTPTATEHKIPAMLTCPAAPRKLRRPACKRKLDFDFLETVAGEEIDSFFRSSFELVAKRRRCPPCT